MQVHHKSFGHTIWRILPAQGVHKLVVELRDAPLKTGRCLLIDQLKLDQAGTEIQLPHPWWFQLYDVYEDLLLVHGYAEPGLPIPRGLYAYNLTTGDLIWQAPQLQAMGLSKDGILAIDPARPENRLLLHPQKGHIVRSQVSQYQSHITDYQASLPLSQFPTVALTQDPIFQQYQASISSAIQGEPILQLEYLSLGEMSWIHAYRKEQRESGLQSFLLCRNEGKWAYISGPHPRKGLLLDAFFVQTGHLYFLAGEHELRIIRW